MDKASDYGSEDSEFDSRRGFYFWFPLHPLPPPSVTGVAFAVRSSFIPIHKPQGARWAKDKDQKDKRHLTPAYF
eukprot:scaffold189261_cov22-Tisochrysis_lutea.AAC.1